MVPCSSANNHRRLESLSRGVKINGRIADLCDFQDLIVWVIILWDLVALLQSFIREEHLCPINGILIIQSFYLAQVQHFLKLSLVVTPVTSVPRSTRLFFFLA